MVSIITCSIQPELCRQMIESVEETIGVAMETIVFDNRELNWGLCKVYNYCAQKAKYPYLCFVHEDILMATKDWGKAMIEFINQTPECGVIGFAGGRSVPRFFYGWSGDKRCRYYEKTPDKHCKKSNTPGTVYYESKHYTLHCENPGNETWSRVLTLDGLFLFCKKSIWQENPFDEHTFKGFHCYDADFTFSIAQHYQNYVCLEADIYHYSNGNLDNTWADAIFAFQNKWKNKTPCHLGEIGFLRNRVEKYHKMLLTYNCYKKNSVPFMQRCSRIKTVGRWKISAKR